ncbi:MAG: hypothetical protein WBX15_21070 [Thermoanaerobaculia bacterium]
MKLVARRKAEQNQAAIDPWTLIHLTSGLAMGLVDIRFRTAMTLSVGYEIIEQFAQRRGWGQALFNVSGPESIPNSVVDVVVFAAGHWLGTRWNATGPAKRTKVGGES